MERLTALAGLNEATSAIGDRVNQIGSPEELISKLAQHELPLVVASGAFSMGIITMTEFINQQESKGRKPSRVERVGAFVVGFTGGAVVLTPLSIAVERLTGFDF